MPLRVHTSSLRALVIDRPVWKLVHDADLVDLFPIRFEWSGSGTRRNQKNQPEEFLHGILPRILSITIPIVTGDFVSLARRWIPFPISSAFRGRTSRSKR